jgi:cardiolipin synthase A/B
MKMLFELDALSIIGFFASLLIVTLVLRAQRSSSNTIAWIIFSLAAPFGAIPIYLFLGKRKLPPRKRIRLVNKGPEVIGVGDLSDIQKILDSLDIPRAKRNESIRIISSASEMFVQYHSLIENAKSSVFLTTFIFSNDEVGRELLAALTKCSLRGVDVRVIVDSLTALLLSTPKTHEFRKAGGKIFYFMPVPPISLRGRSNWRNHRKLLCVDSVYAIVGGMNLTNESMGPRNGNNCWEDLAVRIDGESAIDVEQVFLSDWRFSKKNDRLMKHTAPSFLPPQEGGRAQIVPSGPEFFDDNLYDIILSALFSARNEVSICTPYFIPDEGLVKAMELAVKRGVRVSILLPERSNHFLADLARGSFVRKLKSAGVHFYLHRSMIHAKVFIVDSDCALVGSANFDMRSLLLNFELGVFLFDEDKIAELNLWFNRNLIGTKREFSENNLWRRISEGAGKVIGPFI